MKRTFQQLLMSSARKITQPNDRFLRVRV